MDWLAIPPDLSTLGTSEQPWLLFPFAITETTLCSHTPLASMY